MGMGGILKAIVMVMVDSFVFDFSLILTLE